MSKTRKDYTNANRIAWNEAAPKHAEHNNTELYEAFKSPGHVTLTGDILDALLQVGVEGKSIIQLCCNNGCETLSLRNLGAARCVGVDAADEFLAHGREMIKIAGAEDEVELICCDVYDLPAEFTASFDIVLTTIGVLGWMPDLEDIENKVKYNDSIAGLLIINPDNPTGAVYPRDVLEKIIDIARRYDLFVMFDEIYTHIVYNGAETVHLSEIVGDVAGSQAQAVGHGD